MALHTIQLQHIPADMPIHLALYRDVRNTAFLRQQLLSGNEEFEYAFIDVTMVGLLPSRMNSFLMFIDRLYSACVSSRL